MDIFPLHILNWLNPNLSSITSSERICVRLWIKLNFVNVDLSKQKWCVFIENYKVGSVQLREPKAVDNIIKT